MAAFILAIGILGLTALQSIAIQGSTRSKGYNGAVAVAGHILENIESQARQRWLVITSDSTATLPVYTPNYFPTLPATPVNVNESFTFTGHYPDSTAVNLVDKAAFYTVLTHADPALHSVAGSGSLRNYTVTVSFTEIGPGSISIPRTVVLSKTVMYGS